MCLSEYLCRDRVLQRHSAHLLTAEPSKGPKKANNRLNATWNTTGCKAASFFLFSLRLLTKVFRILRNIIHMQYSVQYCEKGDE